MDTYTNFKCNAYHIYGDKSGKKWSYQELKLFFDIDGTGVAKCISDFIGKPDSKEYYSFMAGDFANVRETFAGFEIR